MRTRLVPLATLLSTLIGCSEENSPYSIEQARKLAHDSIMVDGHIDVPYRLTEQRETEGTMDDISQRTAKGEFDYPRAIEGGLDAFFQSIYTPSEYEGKGAKAFADSLIDLVEGIATKSPDKFVMVRTAAEVRALRGGSRIGFLMGMENGAPIEGDLANLKHFYDRGIRYITLCHAKDNHICDSSYDDRKTNRGLTEFGRKVVAEMNRLGILIDISHVSDDSFYQVIALTKVPVIASHSSVRRFTPRFERNMDDDMIRLLAQNGGVIMINFGSTFVDERLRDADDARSKSIEEEIAKSGLDPESKEAKALYDRLERERSIGYSDVQQVADHFEHVRDLVGVDHLGFGSDFDGVGDSLPVGLKDVSMYPNLIQELLAREFTPEDIEKICGGNLLRVLERAEQFAAGK